MPRSVPPASDEEEQATCWLIPGSAWHPLSILPAPNYVPAQWDGPHVGRRLSEAFRTLSLMPIGTRPPAFHSAWPGCAQEEIDYFAARVDGDAAAIEADRNRVKLVPTEIEIQHMEAAIVWPAHYLMGRAMLMVVGQGKHRPKKPI
jgi:hypothetical protein